jgi:hypothetical protein
MPRPDVDPTLPELLAIRHRFQASVASDVAAYLREDFGVDSHYVMTLLAAALLREAAVLTFCVGKFVGRTPDQAITGAIATFVRESAEVAPPATKAAGNAEN